MILIDENIPEIERLTLLRCKPFRIGYDFWHKGVLDDQIAVRLRAVRQVTFFARDQGFFKDRRRFGRHRIAIVLIDASDDCFARLVDRFLRHQSFRTHSSRVDRIQGQRAYCHHLASGGRTSDSNRVVRLRLGSNADAFTHPTQLYWLELPQTRQLRLYVPSARSFAKRTPWALSLSES